MRIVVYKKKKDLLYRFVVTVIMSTH